MSTINNNTAYVTATEWENITNNMSNLLDEYDYDYNYDALNTIVETWAENKAPLIEAFKKHPNYIEGKFCIAFDTDYNREINVGASRNFSRYIFDLMEMYKDNIPEVIRERANNCSGYYNIPYYLYHFLTSLDGYAFRTLSDHAFNLLNEWIPEIHPHAGEKTARVINRVCTYLGYDKEPNYNREFAKYADSLSPMVIKRHTIISINPLDYLTMSFGNSWASCHTIDKSNKRGMPNSYHGQYSSGTVSYMLDPSSMVFYTVDAGYEGTDYWTQPKINRQMFHYGQDKLVQGRLYPQDNDGNTDEYTIYRRIVQEVISICFDLPNLWTVSKGIENASKYIVSEGTHYKDYYNFSSCTLSRNKEKPNDNIFTVGANPICIECGCTHDNEENINCCSSGIRCADCGRLIEDEDYAHYIDEEYYCEDCCDYCENCGEWVRGEMTYIPSENRSVCECCLDNDYFRCEDCGEYYREDEANNVVDINGFHVDVCNDCLADHYIECYECGEYHRDNEMVTLADGINEVCPDCRRRRYAQCDHCEEWFDVDDLNEAGDMHLCDECLAEIEAEEDTVAI